MLTTPPLEPRSPWHDGEREIRRRAGVEQQMESVGARAIIGVLPRQHRAFYAGLPFLIVGTVDQHGDPWASIISGPQGFIEAPDQGHLKITGHVPMEDPASAGWIAGANVAMLGIEFLTRRRIRANGQLTSVTDELAVLEVQQAFGNCPKYIQAREVAFSADPLPLSRAEGTSVAGLDEESRRIIASADTFFVASYTDRQDHSHRAVDVSHRGGKSGFVRVDNNRLSIPDFSGNQYFNTLGNFVHNPRAGLLFVSFKTGDLLHLTGDVVIDFDTPESRGFAGAERVWHVEVRRSVSRPGVLPLRFTVGELAPTSVATGSWEAARSRVAIAERVDRWLPFRVTAIVQETQDIKSFSLARADSGNLPPFAAGQHVPVRLALHADRATEERLFTLSTAPEDNVFRISVKREGACSSFLHDIVREGHLLELRAPRGGFTLRDGETRPLVLVSAGVGITPMIAMLRHVIHGARRTGYMRQTWFVHGARDGATRAFDAEVGDLVRAAGGAAHLVRFLSSPDPASTPGKDFDVAGRVNAERLQERVPLQECDVYLCGPTAFMQSLYGGLRRLDVPDARIFAETFGPAGLRREPSVLFQALAPATHPVSVLFARSGVSSVWSPGDGPLLDLGISCGLPLAASCHIGQCGTCRVTMRRGAVSYPSAPSAGVTEGTALLCQGVPAEGCTSLEFDA